MDKTYYTLLSAVWDRNIPLYVRLEHLRQHLYAKTGLLCNTRYDTNLLDELTPTSLRNHIMILIFVSQDVPAAERPSDAHELAIGRKPRAVASFKSPTVWLNSKQHLHTHGIFPSAEHGSSSPPQFTVGFETPLVSGVHEVERLPPTPLAASPALDPDERRGASVHGLPKSLPAGSGSGSAGDGSDSEDKYFVVSCLLLPVPLPAVASAKWDLDPDAYEERNSDVQA
ncbi:uncharacterized protein BXZ73DRAFT_108959 [Epithele typhae]|uniref:uncharacterized protein n=1 Tax=Epithele typhae TaxID=378194 RepID=UPI002008C0B0|nr:uncharacterized protein BXZ73DRAFT_108959 [Epithele typhae]KAH9910468.1 hypothetical protein BXZ73DRAFT_108959 [Epithele typhae]